MVQTFLLHNHDEAGGGGMSQCLPQNESPKLLDLGSHQSRLFSQNAFVSVRLLFSLPQFLLRVVFPDVDGEAGRHGQPAQVRHHHQRRYLVNVVPGAHCAYHQPIQAQDVNQRLEQREDSNTVLTLGTHSSLPLHNYKPAEGGRRSRTGGGLALKSHPEWSLSPRTVALYSSGRSECITPRARADVDVFCSLPSSADGHTVPGDQCPFHS